MSATSACIPTYPDGTRRLLRQVLDSPPSLKGPAAPIAPVNRSPLPEIEPQGPAIDQLIRDQAIREGVYLAPPGPVTGPGGDPGGTAVIELEPPAPLPTIEIRRSHGSNSFVAQLGSWRGNGTSQVEALGALVEQGALGAYHILHAR